MVYLLHHPEDRNEVEKKLFDKFGSTKPKLIAFPVDPNLDAHKATFLTYLSDELLKEFLPLASEKDWKVGILPHPRLKHTIKGLGIAGKLEDALREIFNTDEVHKLDLLFCNDVPVFQSVNIGNVFALKQERSRSGFVREVLFFLKNIRKIPNLRHIPFTLVTDDGQRIKTSALGIIVVEHPYSSIVSKRLVKNSAMNDGMFNVLIIAPENVLELFYFLFRSLLPKKKKMAQLPSFIGQLKVSGLTIEDDSEIEYTVDGVQQRSQSIRFAIKPEALILKQTSLYETTTEAANTKKSLKIDSLPRGEKLEILSRKQLPWLPRATTAEFHEIFQLLRENARLRSTFLAMMLLSTLIATFGLFANSSPVIIGAMILAPIISPIVAFSMGMVRYDLNLLKTGFLTILVGTASSLLFSALVALIIPLKTITPEIYARLSPNLLDMGIAVASGIAAAYAHSKEEIAKSLAGVAIAVALVPPLAVAGIGIGWWNWEVFSGAFLLYLTNLIGIIMFAGITFLIFGFAPFKRARLGLIYTLIIIIVVTIPLSLSFERIQEESKIERLLEGSTVEQVILKDVHVRQRKPLSISLRMVSPGTIREEQLEHLKMEIEKRLGQKVLLEVVTAIEF